jgi:hypothetical protein
MDMRKMIPLLLVLLATPSVWAASTRDFRMEVLVRGVSRPEYAVRGTTYIEALKGQEYEIRLTNPYGVRVAVALSVDGLNTIDARHTDARSARKWVLEPHQTIVLRGWQTSSEQAKRFFFTSEEKSYGQWLGRTENLGNISAAFFFEKLPWSAVIRNYRDEWNGPSQQRAPAPAPGEPRAQAGQGGNDIKSKESMRAESMPAVPAKQADELAATGIGRAENHPVTKIDMDLEDSPAAVVTMRYEYRSALVALGVIPSPPPVPDSLYRREKAKGFEDGYCPSPSPR